MVLIGSIAMAFFMVAYDLSKYENITLSTGNNLLGLQLDLERAIGGDRVTDSSFILDCEYRDEDQEMSAEDVFNIIFEELNDLKQADAAEAKYLDVDLEHIRITVVRVDPSDDVISMNPSYQEI